MIEVECVHCNEKIRVKAEAFKEAHGLTTQVQANVAFECPACKQVIEKGSRLKVVWV